VGGAVRRPDKSELCSPIKPRPNLFHQELIKCGGKKKGVKGKNELPPVVPKLNARPAADGGTSLLF
jgi:hypothetical protein